MLISNYAIKFRTAVFVFIAVLVLAGAYSYTHMPREGAPDITIPFVFVTAFYEGTAPEDMETLIAIPLEKHLNDLEGVKELRATAGENFCSVSIEFVAGQDIDQARQRVKDKVDLARPDLPEDLDEPIVDSLNFSSDIPIFICAISGPTTLERLKNFAENLQEDIEQIPGVREAGISGIREREIRVELDAQRLSAYGMTPPRVMARIAQENSTMSAGNIEMKGSKFQVRVPAEFERVDELRDVLLADRGGNPVYLRDVATITDTYKDLASISRLNGKPSVAISVKKRARDNAVRVIDRVKEILETYPFPPDVEFTVVMDQSDYVTMMIEELENNVLSGFLLVITVLFLFMGGRNSLFVAAAIPLSMLVAFALLHAAGETLNMMVLFSLVLAVGMLVDNAIVIVENIYRNHTLGLSRVESARRGTAEVAWPVVTSTLTTLAAFSPLLFWPGMMGQFMSFMPRTLIIVLSASLFVGIVVNPALCAALVSRGKGGAAAEEKPPHPFVQRYERFLRTALANRAPVFIMGLLLLVASLLLYSALGRGQELFPDVEPRNANIAVKFPQGTSIERTDEAMRRIEPLLGKYEDIRFYLTTIGSASLGDPFMGGGEGAVHIGNIHVEYVKSSQRKGDTTELTRVLREEVGQVAGAEVTVEKQEEGPPTGAPVTLEISGEDFEVLSELSAEIMDAIRTVPGLVDLRDDFEEALPELQFRVDRKKAATFGLDPSTIGLYLRTAIYGIESSRFRAGEEEYDITLRFPEGQRNTAALLDQAMIPNPAGGDSVPLSTLGQVVYTGGRGAINRKDQKRMVTISGNDAGRGVDAILKDVKAIVSEVKLPRGYSIHYAGDTEEMQKAASFLGRAFLIASGLILVILVIQFNSVFRPVIIFFSILLSLIGVMWGLLITGMRFSVIMTGLGIISLVGIVVNNAIVLVDCIVQHRAGGMPVTEAIVTAGRLRLRPVLLTAVTTILGLIPMAVGLSLDIHGFPPKLVAGSETSAWWAPMAVAVIFGLGVATILTLVVVPVMYSLAESLAGTSELNAVREE